MGLFNFLRSCDAPKCESNQSELAYQLYCSVGMGNVESAYQKKVDEIHKQLKHNRINILKYAAELIPDPRTPKELYTVAYSYIWAGASCRKLAIDSLKKYIECGKIWDAYNATTCTICGVKVNQLTMRIAHNHFELAQLYEKEHQFNEAEQEYKTAIQIDPSCSPAVIKLSILYSKMDRIDDGIQLLEDRKSTVFYKSKSVESCKSTVDAYLKDLIDKKARGYKYHPRKAKSKPPK